MKKVTSLVLALALLCTLVTGCGSKKEEAAASGEGAKEETVELNLYYWDESFNDAMAKVVDTFEAAHENIKINVTTIPWGEYWTKLQTTLPTDSGPDIFWCNYMYSLEFIPNNLLLPIDTANIDTDQYAAEALDMLSADGQLYAVPFMLDTVAMVYNKDLFDAKGIDYPTADWTWDDLRATAAALTDENHYGYCLDYQSQMGTFNFLLQNGVSVYEEDGLTPNFNSDAAVEAFNFQYDLVFTDKSSPNASQLSELSKGDRFMAGQVAMTYCTSPYVATYYEALGDALGCVELPAGKEEACTLNAVGFAGSANTAHPEEVQMFLEFASTAECQELIAQNGMPACLDAAGTWVANFPEEVNAQAFISMLDVAHRLPLAHKSPAATRSAYESECGNIFAGTKTVEEGLNDAIAAVQAELGA